jgi:hypothetical protein
VSQAKGELTRTQLKDINEKRIALHRRIQAWREAQMVYMPCVASLLTPSSTIAEVDSGSLERVENIPLWLPSSLPASMPSQLRATGILPGLVEKETKLRLAQADDALAEIRRQRRIVTGLVIFKKLNISGLGQKKNTRMRTLFKRFSNKTERVAERYRAARRALEVLDSGGAWQTRLQVLHPEDIRGPGREDIDKHDRRPEMSEKRREQSWIWLVPRIETAQDIGVMEEHLDANLRVEWAKSRARAARWTEEVDLLCEEMRRTLVFLEWKAGWWRKQAYRRADSPVDLRHGIEAYALRQAALQECIADRHAKHWLPVLKAKGFTPCWALRYSVTQASTDNYSAMVEATNGEDEEAEVSDDGDVDEEDVDDNEFEEDKLYDDYEVDH